MTVFIFGNPDLAADALPLRILPQLRQLLPTVTFAVRDPNEEWDVPETLVILDTVVGIPAVTVFDDLRMFSPAPRVTLHDFDALSNLRLLQKLGKLKQVKIIGVPPMIAEGKALQQITSALRSNLP